MKTKHGIVTDYRFDVVAQYVQNGNGAFLSRTELCRAEWDEPMDWTLTLTRHRPTALVAATPAVQVVIEYGNERTQLREPIAQGYADVNMARGYCTHGTSRWARVYLIMQPTGGGAALPAGYTEDIVQATMSLGRPSPWRVYRTTGFVAAAPDPSLAQLIDPLCQDIRLYQYVSLNGIVVPQDIVLRLYQDGVATPWNDIDLAYTGAQLVVPIPPQMSHYMLYSAGGTVGATPALCMAGMR